MNRFRIDGMLVDSIHLHEHLNTDEKLSYRFRDDGLLNSEPVFSV